MPFELIEKKTTRFFFSPNQNPMLIVIYIFTNQCQKCRKSAALISWKSKFYIIILLFPHPGSHGRRYVISGNADFQSAVPQISQLLDNLQSTKQHLNQLWSVKKMRLEQCLQLRIFEEDVEKVCFIY